MSGLECGSQLLCLGQCDGEIMIDLTTGPILSSLSRCEIPGDPAWHLSPVTRSVTPFTSQMSWHFCHMLQNLLMTETSCSCTLFVPFYAILKHSTRIIFMVTFDGRGSQPLLYFHLKIAGIHKFLAQLVFNDRERKDKKCLHSHTARQTAASCPGRDQIFIIIRNFNQISMKVRSRDMGIKS